MPITCRRPPQTTRPHEQKADIVTLANSWFRIADAHADGEGPGAGREPSPCTRALPSLSFAFQEHLPPSLIPPSVTPAPPPPPAEFLPYSSAYEEAEHLRSILKPESALVEGAQLDKAQKAEL